MPIKTQRLKIVCFTEKDIKSYSKIMVKPEVTRYLASGKSWPKEQAEEMAQNTISRWNDICKNGYGVFAVKEIESGQLIGHCGIKPLTDGRLEFLYAYDPTVWGKGYATEAGQAILDYGKNNFDIKEVIGMAYPENVGSIKVLKKLGFEIIGEEEHFGNNLTVLSLKLN